MTDVLFYARVALALNVADVEASYYVDDKIELELEP